MDFADASLVAVAESHRLRSILTLDLDHFSTYRFKRGYSHDAFVLFGTGMIHLATPQPTKAKDSDDGEASPPDNDVGDDE